MRRRTRGPGGRLARQQVDELVAQRTTFGPRVAARRITLLESLAGTTILDPRLLLRYHEVLLFIRAYPDDRKVLDLARNECARFRERVSALAARSRRAARALDDTGIAGTRLHYEYDYTTALALVTWFGGALEIDWDEYENSSKLDLLLSLLSDPVETDGVDLAPISSEEWLARARGRNGRTSLAWLLENLERLSATSAVKRALYDGLELPVVWDLGDGPASRTHAAATSHAAHFHGEPLLHRPADLEAEIRRPLAPLAPVPKKTAGQLMRVVRSALAVRHRSLHPVEYANPAEVLVARCGRGYELVLFGMLPGHRLPLESNYAALIVKNGYPIGYGVGALLFDQVEIAVNVFDTWRGGEAAFIFGQFLRTFHHHFGCTRFMIERYQIGHENDEGLKSGSFWFYHKLGFVSADRAVSRLAAREARLKAKNPAYRSSIRTLKRLATADLFLTLPGARGPEWTGFPLADLGLAVTELVGVRFGGDRLRARAASAAEVARTLGCPEWQSWPRDERAWFERLSLMVVQIPDLADWPAEERTALARVMRAKGRPGETEFVRAALALPRLREALRAVAVRRPGKRARARTGTAPSGA